MQDIRTLLTAAARRLGLTTYIHALHTVAIFAAIAVLLLMVADRLPAESWVPWAWVGPGIGVVAIIAAAIIWSTRRLDEQQVALLVDERLDLREKLTTALHCGKRDEPFAQAAVADAVRTAQDPRRREELRRRFPVAAPKSWWISPLIVLAAVMVSFLNQADAFTSEPDNAAAIEEASLETTESIEAVVNEIEKNEALAKELSDMLGDDDADGVDPEAPRTPEEAKRNAIKKVTDINKRLEEILNGEKGKTNESLEAALKDLKTPESGPAKEFAEALSEGNFENAKQALEKMLNDLEEGKLTEDQKKQLAEQMKDLAEQLEDAAKQQKQLEDALKQAGLDPDLANDAEALKKALEQNENLNEQQKQQIQQMAKAQQAAQQMCKGMSKACQGMSQSMQNGQPGEAGKAGQQMSDQLSEMESLQQMLQQAQAAKGECQGQCQQMGAAMAQGQWKKSNSGMGNWGAGKGGQGPKAPTPTGFTPEKANVTTTGEGDVIARMLVDGPLQVGESKKSLKSIITETVEGYDEAQVEDQLPPKYKDAQKHYFGELEKKVAAMREAEATSSSSEESSGEAAEGKATSGEKESAKESSGE